jgi:hypothetical protein
VFSISGQADAIGQSAGGPVIGAIGNVWGIRAALLAGATALAPAAVLFARASQRREVIPARAAGTEAVG